MSSGNDPTSRSGASESASSRPSSDSGETPPWQRANQRSGHRWGTVLWGLLQSAVRLVGITVLVLGSVIGANAAWMAMGHPSVLPSDPIDTSDPPGTPDRSGVVPGSRPTPAPIMDNTTTGYVNPTGPNVSDRKVNVTKVERWMVGYTNAERAARDIEPLVVNPEVTMEARNYSRYMAAEDELTHGLNGETLIERWNKHGYDCRAGQENIQRMDFDAPSLYADRDRTINERKLAKRLVSRFMWSVGHRRAMLNSRSEVVGIGVYIESTSGDDYVVWVTEHFCWRRGKAWEQAFNGSEDAFIAPRVTYANTSELRYYNASRYPGTVTPIPTVTPDEDDE